MNFGRSLVWPIFPAYVVREADQPIGYGGAHQESWMAATGRCRIDLAVAPAHRHRGVGGALLERLLAASAEFGARLVDMRVREDQAEGQRFAEKHGFAESERVWELELLVADAPPAGPAMPGIDIQSYAQLRGTDPDASSRVHELWCSVAADQPQFDPAGLPPADRFHSWIERETGQFDGWFVALEGDAYIGLCVLLQRDYYQDALMQNITGVRRSHRRRGIATALKHRAIAAAREHGYARLTTVNDNRNSAMLALNEKLGFQRRPGWITYERALKQEP